jgi:peptide-methionine (S)-S-oxide reductase
MVDGRHNFTCDTCSVRPFVLAVAAASSLMWINLWCGTLSRIRWTAQMRRLYQEGIKTAEQAMFFLKSAKTEMVSPQNALAGRAQPIPTAQTHFVNGAPLRADPASGLAVAMVGMGCFWGVERMFWKLDGVVLTMVGYAGGYTPNPIYEEVCTGQTGHNEVVRIIFDPAIISYEQLMQVFWEGHDPTQGMRQGNDRGTQYRSGIYTFDDSQKDIAIATKAAFAPRLTAAGYGAITTEIIAAPTFYFAEDYHQQYLAKNPNGYCGIGGTGVTCPVGVGA